MYQCQGQALEQLWGRLMQKDRYLNAVAWPVRYTLLQWKLAMAGLAVEPDLVPALPAMNLQNPGHKISASEPSSEMPAGNSRF